MASIERQSVPEALREEEDTSAGESTAFSSLVEFAVDLNARPPLTVAYRSPATFPNVEVASTEVAPA
jgi:hypothetical protein